ncbi:hypothetical protein BC834DRAFT_549801 [Gloeopeniophorella convolvens]|nr:hypothetical protein BC834DRAFT_549801 [Gloeopeniophorella convolvens]
MLSTTCGRAGAMGTSDALRGDRTPRTNFSYTFIRGDGLLRSALSHVAASLRESGLVLSRWTANVVGTRLQSGFDRAERLQGIGSGTDGESSYRSTERVPSSVTRVGQIRPCGIGCICSRCRALSGRGTCGQCTLDSCRSASTASRSEAIRSDREGRVDVMILKYA